MLVVVAVLCIPVAFLHGCSSDTAAIPDGTGAAVNATAGSSLAEDTVMLTVDGSPVFWPEFRYWLEFISDYYKDVNGLEAIADWKVEQNGVPLDEFFLGAAVDYAGRHRALEARAAEMGIEVTRAELDEIAATRADNVRIYGSEAEYLRIVSQAYVSEDVYTYLLKMGYLSDHVFAELYGAKGEKCTDEDVAAYVAEQGLMRARYVFRSSTGTGAAELSDSEKEADRELLEDLLRQLDASDDPVALFASFEEQYSQDTRALDYPDGVLFVTGGMGEEFEKAFANLADGAHSGVIQTAEGAYLILRLPIDPDMAVDAAGTPLRYRAAYDYLYKKVVDAWYAEMDVEYTRAYETLDLKGLID